LKGLATSQVLRDRPPSAEARFRSHSDTAAICSKNRSSKTDPSSSASVFPSQNCFSNPPCTSATNAIQFTHQWERNSLTHIQTSWRQLNNEKRHVYYLLLRRTNGTDVMRDTCSTHDIMRNMYKILTGKFVSNVIVWRLKLRWENIIKKCDMKNGVGFKWLSGRLLLN